MRKSAFRLLASLVALLAFVEIACLAAQDTPGTSDTVAASRLVVGRPFSAIKFAHRIKVLPDGKRRFLRNEQYPTQIARDADGRLMMQEIRRADLGTECDHLDELVPPPCPDWSVVVIDPVAHTVTHWLEGEIAYHGAVDFPLSPMRLEEAADSTSSLPALGPDFSEEDGKVSRTDLGDRSIEGILAHGVRWTLRYQANQNGEIAQRTRIHEVWTSTEMQLIVRVIDGDPNGEETVRGLKKISLAPNAALFRPPDGYRMEHWRSDHWEAHNFIAEDFEYLKSWFEM